MRLFSKNSKGTGNSEIVLDRKIADKRVFPAIDIQKSGTRKEELLVPREIRCRKCGSCAVFLIRWEPWMPSNSLIDKLKDTKNNDDFFQSMNQ
jgi:transcription termination factor Rho